MIATKVIEQDCEEVNIAILDLPNFDESVVKFSDDLSISRQ